MDDKPENKDADQQTTEEKVKESSKAEGVASKIPDISGLADKLDFDKILGGIKSMIGAEEEMDVDPNDALGQKIEKLSLLFKEMTQSHAKLAKDSAKANELLVALFKDLEALRSKK